MRKFLRKLIFIAVIIAIILFLLNIEVTTKQGIDYQVQTISMPLYLKLLGFLDRYYNYKQLLERIIKDTKSDKERVMKIFEWTYQNIRKVPEGFPIIDDHVWHIIVRGYGVSDQSSDVFATLCNCAGIEATYSWVSAPEAKKAIVLSFVKLEDNWAVFDPYHGVYFKDENGDIADVQAIRFGNWTIESRGEQAIPDYAAYFNNLPSLKEIGLTRPNIQSPWNRLLLEIKRQRKKY